MLSRKVINVYLSRRRDKKLITLLNDEENVLASLRGGPLFGKTSIAIEVSHKLSEHDKIPLVFSQLTTATNEDEMIGQLCLDDGAKQSLSFRLKDTKKKVVFVLNNIDNLLEEKHRCIFDNFIRFLLAHDKQLFQLNICKT